MTYKVDANSLVGGDIPNAYIQAVTLSDGSCELKLGLKDLLNRGREAHKSWSGNSALYNQFKLKIIRSLDPETTKELVSLSSPRGPRILEKIEEKNFKNRVSVGEVSLAGTTSGDLETNLSSEMVDGKMVKNFTIMYSDTDLPKDLKHLTYFVIVYYKMLDASSSLHRRGSESLVGMCTTQTVLRAGTVPKKATLYVLREEPATVWAGPVHAMKNGQYHTGLRHSSQSRALTRKAINNDKVQDLRGVTALDDSLLDVSIAQFEKFPTHPNEIEFSFKNNISVADRGAIFTDLYSAHDNNGAVRLFFGIDQDALRLYHTKLGALYGQTLTSAALEGIPSRYLQTGQIQRLILKRQRVNPNPGFNRLCSPVNGASPFDNEEVDTTIFRGTPESMDSSAVVKNMNIFVGSGVSNLSYYGAVDVGLRDVSYGKYQYKIDLEVLDRSDEIVGNIVQELSDARRVLLAFMNEGSLPGNYDRKLDKFSKAFTTSSRSLEAARAITIYAQVLGWVSLLSGNKNFIGVEETERLMVPFVLAANANPGTVQDIIDAVESLAAVVGRLGGTGTRSGVGAGANDISSIQQDAPDKTSRNTNSSLKIVKVENVFEEQFDADFVRNVGYDYLTTESHQTAPGLHTVRDSAYYERVNVETSKYFVSNDVNIDITVRGKKYTESDTLKATDTQYLSPASTTVFGSTHKMIDTLKTDDYRYREVEKDVLYYNLQLSLNDSIASPNDPTCALETREDLLMKMNSISNLGNSQKKRFTSFFNTGDDPSEESDSFVAPSFDEPAYSDAVIPKAVKPLNSMVFDGILRKKTLVQSSHDACTTGYVSNIDSFNTLLDYNEAFLVDPTRQQKLTNLPNQIKSVVLGNISSDAINVDWFQTQLPELDDIMGPLFRLNFNALRQVETLIGFERSPTGLPLVKMPIFAPLTRQRIESAPPGTQLVCRLVPYTNTDFSLNGLPNNLKLPIYNKYFVIERTTGVPFVTTATTNPPSTMQASLGTSFSGREEANSTEMVQYSHTELPSLHRPRRSRAHASRQRVSNSSTGQDSGAY